MQFKGENECAWDAIAISDPMIRFDPGDVPVRDAQTFQVWHGGGEYNAVSTLARWGMRCSLLSAHVNNELGELRKALIRGRGVDVSKLIDFPYDGIGKDVRVALNFVYRGFGHFGGKGVSDRAYSACEKLSPDSFDLHAIFANEGVRWLHCGGIFAALSDSTAELTMAAATEARKNGTIVTFDLNYRPSLWQRYGEHAKKRAQEVMRRLVKEVDIVFGNEGDYSDCLGYEVKNETDGVDGLFSSYERMIKQLAEDYPNLCGAAVSLRKPYTASKNHWSGLYWDGHESHRGPYLDVEIKDRVGGGDSFVSGLMWALMHNKPPKEAIKWAIHHGAIAMATPGDLSLAFDPAQVEKAVAGGDKATER